MASSNQVHFALKCLPIAAMLIALGVDCSVMNEPRTTYTITPDPACRGVDVSVKLAGQGQTSIRLRSYVPLASFQCSSVVARGPRGEALPVRQTLDSIGVPDGLVAVPAWVVEGPLPPLVTLNYRMHLGRREGGAHMGFRKRVSGFQSSEWIAFVGRHAFLLPGRPGRIEVRYRLPPGWRVATPWSKKNHSYVPGIGGALVQDHLVTAAVAMGRLRERRCKVGGTEYSFVFPDTLDPAEEARTVNVLESTAQYVHSLFRRELGDRYTVVVLPKTPEGDEIEGSSWATGQGSTLWPTTPQRLHRYASNLIRAYIRDEPFSSRIRSPDEYWLVDGLSTFFGWRAVARAELVSEEAVVQDLALSYLNLLPGMKSRNLEQVYSGEIDRSLAADVVSPLVLALLDREMRSKAAGPLDALMPRIFNRAQAASLWATLRRVSHADWSVFRSRYVRGHAVAPVHVLFPARATGEARGDMPADGTQLTLAYTGNTRGYLETCGCKVNQAGGIARRASVLKQIRRASPNSLVLDLGGMLPDPEIDTDADFLSREEEKFYMAAVDRMRYDAASIGTTDLASGLPHLADVLRGREIPITVCNVHTRAMRWPSFVLLRRGRLTIGVIGVFEPPSGTHRGNGLHEGLLDLDVSSPVEGVASVMDSIGGRIDFAIVMGRLQPTTVRRLVERCPQVDVILTTESKLPRITGGAVGRQLSLGDSCGLLDSTLVLYASQKQYGVGVAHVRISSTNTVASADVGTRSLSPEVPDDEMMRDMLASFYRRIGKLPAAGASVGSLFPDDSLRQWSRYVGAQACQECHSSEYDQWVATPHAMAYKTLLERHRHYQPRCVACHVVGYGTRHGFKVGDPEEILGNVQCEVCHGAGEAHARSPDKLNIRREVPEAVCIACHNPEHSDHFVYREKVREVDHSPATMTSARHTDGPEDAAGRD